MNRHGSASGGRRLTARRVPKGLLLSVLAACSLVACIEAPAPADQGDPYPEPQAFGDLTGPGGPQVTYTSAQLDKTCAWVSGGEGDTTQHHNIVTMYDGLMLMPWSPETSKNGGVTFFDISDPCAPKTRGYAATTRMRETHSVGFSERSDASFAVVNHGEIVFGSEKPFQGGVLFWDITDPTAPTEAGVLKFDEFAYPDAYAFVVLSVFWQGDVVYVASGDNGLYIVDAKDPTQPKLLGRYVFDPILRAGQVIAVGNLLVVAAADEARAVLLDISDPVAPKAIAGGDFVVADKEGKPRKAYFANLAGSHLYFTRKDNGGGLIVYDIQDPSQPTFAGQITTDGKGGYVTVKDDIAVSGESNHAVVIDVSDLKNMKEIKRLKMPGDLDTATPIGNVIVLSVDDKADADKAGSGMVPFLAEPDVKGPAVTWVYPADGAVELARSSRVGVTFSELVEPKSAWAGSVRLYETDKGPARGRVHGAVNAQELVVNFTPREPLQASTRYTLEIPAGGVTDANGNPTESGFTATFTTGAL